MYGKIFKSIYESTLMSQHGWLGVYIFSSMVVLADKNGVLEMDERQFFRRIGLDEPFDVELGIDDPTQLASVRFSQFQRIIEAFCQPDPNSAIQALEGKRLIKLSEMDEIPSNRGWFIVNYAEYLKRGTKERENEYARGYMAAIRKLHKKSKNGQKKQHVRNQLDSVRSVRNSLDELEHIDIDIDIDKDIDTKKKESTRPKGLTPLSEYWNTTCKNLPKIKAMSDDRRRKEKLRVSRLGEETIRDAIDKVSVSGFACGENDRGWKMTYDFLIRSDENILKAAEGSYDSKKEKSLKEKFMEMK